MGQEIIEVGPAYRDALPDFNRVVDGLYIGSVNALRHAKRFDVIVNMARELNLPSLGVPTVKIGLVDRADHPFSPRSRDARKVVDMADQIVHWLETGKKVLVICNIGLNRSSLMVGMVLLRMGYDPATVVARLRKRSPLVLSNRGFEDFLYHAYERGL
jgi:hypothetical protein